MERILRLPIHELPDRFFADLAYLLCTLPPLDREPGWRFGSAETNPTPAVRVRLAMWEAARKRHGGINVELPWHENTRIRTPLGNDLNRCVFVSGSFEPNELTLMRDLLEPGMVVIDAGANEGLFTLVAAKKVGSEGHVYAFEPSPRERAILEANVALNQLTNTTVLPQALAEMVGEATLTIAENEHAGQNTLGKFIYEVVKGVGSIQIFTQTIDNLVRTKGLDRVDFIKADIEGAEAKMLRGALRTLRVHRPMLLLEISDQSLRSQGSSEAALHELLRGNNYQLHEFDPATGEATKPFSDSATSRNVFADARR
ncbi:MAG: FkbM family methyltransferase [Burkholderiales bacterium]